MHGSSSEAQVRRDYTARSRVALMRAVVQGLSAVRKMLADNLGACLLVFD